MTARELSAALQALPEEHKDLEVVTAEDVCYYGITSPRLIHVADDDCLLEPTGGRDCISLSEFDA